MRLTALYGATFLVAGAALLVINYALLQRRLPTTKVITAPTPTASAYLAAKKALSDPSASPEVQDLARKILAAPPDVAAKLAQSAPLFQVNGKPTEVTKVGSVVRSDALNALVEEGAVALAVMALASGALGWVLAGRALRPVKEVTATAQRISAENLHDRIDLDGPRDELRELAETFDEMLERLDTAFDSQRRFVANASHELRTPLTIMRTELDVTLRDPSATNEQLRTMAETVRAAVERSERLVDALLVLAATGHPLEHRETVDLADVADDVVDELRGEAGRLGIDVRIALDHAPVRGDADLLGRLVQNLVENGIRHNRPGGWVEVTTSGAPTQAHLAVTSTGPQVPADEIPDLFEPFRRGGTARVVFNGSGVGLGLSIVRSVAAAHGGTAEGEPVVGGGLRVSVSLPLVADEAATPPSDKGA